jgi:hypothetical protein
MYSLSTTSEPFCTHGCRISKSTVLNGIENFNIQVLWVGCLYNNDLGERAYIPLTELRKMSLATLFEYLTWVPREHWHIINLQVNCQEVFLDAGSAR